MNSYICLFISKMSFGLLIACCSNTLGQSLLLTGPPVVKMVINQELFNVKDHYKIKPLIASVHANKKSRLSYRLLKMKVSSFRVPLIHYRLNKVCNGWNPVNTKVFCFEEPAGKMNLSGVNTWNFPTDIHWNEGY